ncbi:MAG: hypothetical protein FJ399_14795 [Verrucomicrobia bacterium]|nr:hypothetical protein [Verrucomicrobiota bacterium]
MIVRIFLYAITYAVGGRLIDLLGMALAARMQGQYCPVPMHFIGVLDCLAESDDYVALMAKYGISPSAIVAKTLGLLALGQAVPSATVILGQTT